MVFALKQASRVLNEAFDEFVCSTDIQVLAFDRCFSSKITERHCVLLLVYIEEVLISKSSTELIVRTKIDLKDALR